jgi:tape measure domain-containing protein
MADLGSLRVSLELDTKGYDATLAAYRKRTESFGKELERALKIGSFKLTPQVDDSALTALNKHLDLKKKHFQELQSYFNANPLSLSVDDRALKNFSKLTAGGKHTVSIKLDNSNFEKTITDSILKGFKSAGSSNSGNLLGNLITSPLKAFNFAVSRTFEGAFNSLGANISRELNKGIADGVNKGISPLIGSFNLVGRELGNAIVDEMIKSLGRNVNSVQKFAGSVLGEENIAVESGAVRAKQQAEQRAKRSSAISYYASNYATTDRTALKAENEKVFNSRPKEIIAVSKALETRKAKKLADLGGAKVQADIDNYQQDIEKLLNQRNALSDSDIEAKAGIDSTLKILSVKLAKRKESLSFLTDAVTKSFQKEQAQLEDLIDRTAVEQYNVTVKNLEALGNAQAGYKVKPSDLPASIKASRSKIASINSKRSPLLDAGKKDNAQLKDIDLLFQKLLPEPAGIEKITKNLEAMRSEYDGLDSVLKTATGEKRDQVQGMLDNISAKIASATDELEGLKSSPNFKFESINKEIEALNTRANNGENVTKDLEAAIAKRAEIESSEGFDSVKASQIQKLKTTKDALQVKQVKRISLIKKYNEQLADEQRSLEGLLAQSDAASNDPALKGEFKKEVARLSKSLAKNEKELADALSKGDVERFKELSNVRAGIEAQYDNAANALKNAGGIVEGSVKNINEIFADAKAAKIQASYDTLVKSVADIDEQIVNAIADNNKDYENKLKTLKSKVVSSISDKASELAALGVSTPNFEAKSDDRLSTEAIRERANRPFRDILSEVAKASGVDVSAMPEMRISNLKEGVKASYSVEDNKVNVSKDLYARAAANKLTVDEFNTLIHELRHAVQSEFGTKSISESANSNNLIAPTVDELKKLGASIELSVATNPDNTNADKSSLRLLEADAYTFAERNTESIMAKVQNKKAVDSFTNKVGLGGGILAGKTAQIGSTTVDKLQRISSLSEVDITEEYQRAVKLIDEKFSELTDILAQSSMVENLPIDEIEKLGDELVASTEKIQKEILRTINELNTVSATKPEAVREQIKASLPQFSRKKDLIPLAESVGIEDAQKLSKKALIDRLASTDRLRELHPQVNALTQAKAQRQIARNEKFSDLAYGAGQIANSTGNFLGNTANPALKAMLKAGSATGKGLLAAGRTGYGIMQGAENIALDALPFGRTMKGIGQNVVLPMALTGAATHMIPGASGAVNAAQHLISGGLQPLAQAGGNEVLSAATGAIKSIVPNLGGMQAHAIEAVSSGIDALVSSATGALAEGAAAIGTGKIIQSAASQPLKALGSNEPKRKALPSADPTVEYVYGIEKSIRSAYKELKEESKKKTPDRSKMQMIGSAIVDLSEKANAEISNLLVNLTEEYKNQFGDDAATKMGGAKGRVTQALNRTKALLLKEGVDKLETSYEAPKIKSLPTLRLPPSAPISKPEIDYVDVDVEAEVKSINAQELFGAGDIVAGFKNTIKNAINGITAKSSEEIASKLEEISADLESASNVSSAEIEAKLASLEEELLTVLGNDVEAINEIIKKRQLTASEVEASIGSAQNSVAEGFNPNNLSSVNKAENVQVHSVGLNSSERYAVVENSIEEQYNNSHENLSNTLENQFTNENSSVPGLDAAKSEINDYIESIKEGLASIGIGGVGLDTLLSTLKDNLPEALGIANNGIKGLISNSGLLLKAFVSFQVLRTITPLMGDLFNSTTKVATEFERLGNVIDFGSGGNSAGTLSFLNSEAERLNVNLLQSYRSYSQLAATSKDTALEGKGTEQAFSAVSQVSALYGLDTEQQERAFTALSQIISKGVVQSEELKGQLAEAIPGATQIAARAFGVTTAELQKMIETGSVGSEEFITKFSQQLSAETAGGAAKSAETTSGKVSELENNILSLQKTVGDGLLPVKRLGLDVANSSLDGLKSVLAPVALAASGFATILSFNLAASLLGVAKGSGLMGVALKLMSGAFNLIIPDIKAFALQFVVFEAAINVIGMMANAFKDGGGEIRNFANSAKADLEAYNQALAKSRGETEKFSKSTGSLKGESLLGQTALGAILPKEMLGGIEEFGVKSFDFMYGGLFEMFGKEVVTNAEKVATDISVATNELLVSANANVSELYSKVGSGNGDADLSKIKAIDAELEDLQQKRRATDPSNKEGVRAIQTQIDSKLTERGKLSEPVGKLASNTEAIIRSLEGTLTQYDKALSEGRISQEQFDRETGNVKQTLDAARKAQDKFNAAIGDSVDKIAALSRELRTVGASLADANVKTEKFSSSANTVISDAQANGEISAFTADNAKVIVQQETLARKIQANIEAISRYKKALESSTVQQTLGNYGLENAGANEIKAAIENNTAISGTKDETVLKAAAEAKEQLDSLDTEVANYQGQIAENRVRASESLKNTTKAINEYILSTTRGFDDLSTTIRDLDVSTAIQNVKNKLQTKLKGFNTRFFSDFTNGLMDMIDTLYEPLKNAMNAQNQIKNNQRNLQDKLMESQQLTQQFQGTNTGFGVNFTGEGVNRAGTRLLSTNGSSPDREVSANAHVGELYNHHRSYSTGFGTPRDYVLTPDVNDPSKDVGAPIYSPTPAQVSYAGNRGDGYGNVVELADLTGKAVARYAHLNSISVNTGQQLKPGDQIGGQGASGGDYATHLHLEASDSYHEQFARSTVSGNYAGSAPASAPASAQSSAVSLDRLRQAILGQESGGNPQAVNTRTGALGLYQVMPDNLPSWSQQTVGRSVSREEFLSDPALQTTIVNGIMGKMLETALSGSSDMNTSIRKVASEWYSGQQSLYDDNSPVAGGAEPSIREYTTQVLGRYGQGSNGSSGSVGYSVAGAPNTPDLSGINKANSYARSVTDEANNATVNNLASIDAAAAIKLRQQIDSQKRSLRNDSEDVNDLRIQRERELEDRNAASLPQTPQNIYDTEMRSITRAEDDATRDLQRDSRDIEESLSELKVSRDFLIEFGKTKPEALEFLPELDQAIANVEADGERIKKVLEQTGESYDKERQALIDKFKSEENSRELSRRSGALSIDQSLNEVLTAQQRRAGFGTAAVGQANSLNDEQINLDIDSQLQQLEEERIALDLSNDEYERRKELLEELRTVKLEENDVSIQRQNENFLREQGNAVGNSRASVADAKVSTLQAYGVQDSPELRDIQKTAAIEAQQLDFSNQIAGLEELRSQFGYTNESIAIMRDNITQVNDLKLEAISQQFSQVGDITQTIAGSFGSAFSSLISGSMDAKEALLSFLGSIASQLASAGVNQLIGSLLGSFSGVMGGGSSSGFSLGTPGSMSGGFGGGDATSSLISTGFSIGSALLGGAFNEGGVIGKENNKIQDSAKGIRDALRKEGVGAKLIVAKENERILTIAENKEYERLGLDKIVGYRDGGRIGNGLRNTPSVNAPAMNSVSVNVPITVNSDGGDDNGIDDKRLQGLLRRHTLDLLVSEQRPGGSLSGLRR